MRSLASNALVSAPAVDAVASSPSLVAAPAEFVATLDACDCWFNDFHMMVGHKLCANAP